jgi:hypothetical protein
LVPVDASQAPRGFKPSAMTYNRLAGTLADDCVCLCVFVCVPGPPLAPLFGQYCRSMMKAVCALVAADPQAVHRAFGSLGTPPHLLSNVVCNLVWLCANDVLKVCVTVVYVWGVGCIWGWGVLISGDPRPSVCPSIHCPLPLLRFRRALTSP